LKKDSTLSWFQGCCHRCLKPHFKKKTRKEEFEIQKADHKQVCQLLKADKETVKARDFVAAENKTTNHALSAAAIRNLP
jgi:hypothetical protein